MGKKPTKVDFAPQTETVRRTQQNFIPIHNGKNKQYRLRNRILKKQCMSSRHLYNKCIYGEHSYYSNVHPAFLNYYIVNIHHYLTKFSTRDKIVLFIELIRRGDICNINILLSYVRTWEVNEFNSLILNAEAKIENCVLIDPIIHDVPKISYSYDYQTIVDLIDKIGLDNFSNKYGSNHKYVSVLREALNKKIDNQKKTAENPKRKRTRKSNIDRKPPKPPKTPKKVAVKKEDIQKGIHLIPSSYLNNDVLEQYVKLQFDIEAKERKDKYNPYHNMGSQVAQQVLKKVDKNYSSFFRLRETDKTANVPGYIRKGGFVLVFPKTSYQVEHTLQGTFVKLALGNNMKKIMKNAYPETEGFIWFKVPNNIIKDGGALTEIEITPGRSNNFMLINYKYDIKVPVNVPLKNTDEDLNYRSMSLDTGMVNLITAFSQHIDHPIIYKGGYVVYKNEIYKHVIEKKYQPELDRLNNKKNKSPKDFRRIKNIKKHMDSLWEKRSLIIKDYFHKLSSDLIKICIKAKINEIIIGYNINWKNNVDKMARSVRDRFYKIPYRMMIDMIFYKAEKAGIKVRENEESYTSICDALAWESIERHDVYEGERIFRGLFSSSKWMLINADVNGAINIQRKALKGNVRMLNQLKNFLETDKGIYNPVVRKIHYDKKVPLHGNDEETNIKRNQRKTQRINKENHFLVKKYVIEEEIEEKEKKKKKKKKKKSVINRNIMKSKQTKLDIKKEAEKNKQSAFVENILKVMTDRGISNTVNSNVININNNKKLQENKQFSGQENKQFSGQENKQFSSIEYILKAFAKLDMNVIKKVQELKEPVCEWNVRKVITKKNNNPPPQLQRK